MEKRNGFTLIELLVVIAIIGLLASIVMVGLNSARLRSKDGKVQQEVVQLRSQFNLDYNSTAQTYAFSCPALKTVCESGTNSSGALTTTGASWGTSAAYANLATEIWKANSNGLKITASSVSGSASSPATGFALYAKLPSSAAGPTKYFCVDSRGGNKLASDGPPMLVPSGTPLPPVLTPSNAAVCR